jgi:SulP family sulfate permease
VAGRAYTARRVSEPAEAAALQDPAVSWREAARFIPGDIAGGFSAALIAIPYAMTLGLIAFAPFGAEYAAVGVVAALVASVIANVIAALVPAARCQIMGPRASITVVFSGILAGLATHPLLHGGDGLTTPELFGAAFLIVAVAGVMQLGFAASGVGRVIKFVPYPVVAGFMNGIALLLILSQLAPALGLEIGRPLAALLAEPAAIKPASLVIALVVLATVFLAPRVTKRVPPLACGLAAGIVLHHAIAAFLPAAVGPVVGALPDLDLGAGQLAAISGFARASDGAIWLQVLLPAALLLAAVAALDGLLAAVAADGVTRGHHDSRRVLAGQGLSNLVGAAFGAVPIAANAHTRIGNYLAGGRTRFSALFHALFMAAALLGLGPFLGWVPIAALAGIVFYIAWTLLDRWTRELARRLRGASGFRAELGLNLLIVLAVALTLVTVNVMVAFAVGVAGAAVLLLVKLSGSPVRRVLDGTMRMSLKVRAAEARALLQPLAKQIRILELEGEVFFGTAEQLKAEVERLPEGARYAILDFRRVHEIDASGARMLDLIAQLAAKRNLSILLSHVRPDDPLGAYLRALGTGQAIDPARWFRDLDRALEWAEDRLLERARFEDAPERAPQDMSLFAGLEPAERDVALQALERHELAHGDTVFLEGDPGDRLYLIARGAVSIKVKLDGEARARRLATFGSGVFFGEMAIVEASRRSADAFAKGDRVVLYSLSAAKFAELVARHPGLALKIYQNLARELASRLRSTSGALRALE